MSSQPVYLIGFPADEDADLRVQLGRVLPDTVIDTPLPNMENACLMDDALIFVKDSMTAEATVTRIFEQSPQASIIVLASSGNQVRAVDLMRMGAMDYRILPCPDEVLAIYTRKAGHQAELTKQASKQQENTDTFVTHDLETRRLLNQVSLIAPSRASILVIGESGTGKERISRFIHQCSNRNNRPFIAINCAAIPEGMLESELFGHEKGSFTGATSSRPGKFEMAHQGTLLLDEITEMPLHLQAKLLRVLQEGEVDRLGGRAPIKIDVRIIATSNRDIVKSVAEGVFRQDLYYRLNVVTVQLPCLRHRPGDIEPLTHHFLEHFSAMYGKPAPVITRQALCKLCEYSWPGNVRELENCMHRAFLMGSEGKIDEEHLGLEAQTPAETTSASGSHAIAAGMSIRDMERALIQETVKHVQGNRSEAAKLLGISIRTLRNKLNDMAAVNAHQSGTALADTSVGNISSPPGNPSGVMDVCQR
ncbi:MAG: sigma-54 dependent transcriptional regulator [Mariprofundaceae bacterium]|nr:sigma-54 dependent transcriptional regulator [Mariprofundaceae bacterium]